MYLKITSFLITDSVYHNRNRLPVLRWPKYLSIWRYQSSTWRILWNHGTSPLDHQVNPAHKYQIKPMKSINILAIDYNSWANEVRLAFSQSEFSSISATMALSRSRSKKMTTTYFVRSRSTKISNIHLRVSTEIKNGFT